MPDDIARALSNIAGINTKDPLELTPSDIDDLILYELRAKRSRESGMKVKKADSSPKIDHIQERFTELGIIKAKPTYTKRKI